MKAASSTRDRLVARKPHHQRRHRQPVIHMGRDHAAAGRAALALHDQVVALDLDRDAIDAQHVGGRGEAVGFLHPQFAAGRASASCLPRTTPAPRGSDIRRSSRARAPPAHRRRASPRRLTRRSATSSPPSLRVDSVSIEAPISRKRHEQAGAQRIGHHAFEHDLGARHDQRRDQRKRRRGRIGRHLQRRRRQAPAGPSASTRRPCSPMRLDAKPARRNASSIFSV